VTTLAGRVRPCSHLRPIVRKSTVIRVARLSPGCADRPRPGWLMWARKPPVCFGRASRPKQMEQ